MNKYEITFKDGTTKSIKADYHAVINCGVEISGNWFVLNNEVVLMAVDVERIDKIECCDNCANGNECESKD